MSDVLQIESSPATKLQNLLLESRMMIQKLEDSSIPVQQGNTTEVKLFFYFLSRNRELKKS